MEHPSCYRWFSNWIGKNRKKEGGSPFCHCYVVENPTILVFDGSDRVHTTRRFSGAAPRCFCPALAILFDKARTSPCLGGNWSRNGGFQLAMGVALDGFGWLTLPAMEPPKWNLQSQRPTRVWSYLLRIRILCVLALVNRHPMFLERVRLCLALEPFCCCYVHPQYQPKFSARPLRANIGFTMSYSAVTTMKPPACRLK